MKIPRCFYSELWNHRSPYKLALTWLTEHDGLFRTAMKGRVLNFRGRLNYVPTVHYIVKKLREDPRVKPSREFGNFFACRVCSPLSAMHANACDAFSEMSRNVGCPTWKCPCESACPKNCKSWCHGPCRCESCANTKVAITLSSERCHCPRQNS